MQHGERRNGFTDVKRHVSLASSTSLLVVVSLSSFLPPPFLSFLPALPHLLTSLFITDLSCFRRNGIDASYRATRCLGRELHTGSIPARRDRGKRGGAGRPTAPFHLLSASFISDVRRGILCLSTTGRIDRVMATSCHENTCHSLAECQQ